MAVRLDFYPEIKRIDVSSIPSSDFEAPSGDKLVINPITFPARQDQDRGRRALSGYFSTH
jgi:hypothetical protein